LTVAEERPTFWLIAGPNGVGKTTFAFKRLKAVSGSFHFVNLDEIARGLSPLEPKAAERDAARIALARARQFIEIRRTFSMETTLSGATHLDLARLAASNGMAVKLMYFSVRDPQISLDRIARRVAEGGHDVPRDIVLRRFARSFQRLREMIPLADLWRIYEASGLVPLLAAEGQRDRTTHVDEAVVASGSPDLRKAIPTP
jgi:predicted ABC-type ATPase